MKKSIFAIAMSLCLLVGTNAFARMQGPRGPQGRVSIEQRANSKTERIQQQLGLSDEQASKVYVVQLEQMRQMQALRRQMQILRQAEVEQMKAILTPEQFEAWRESQQRMGQGGRSGMRQGPSMRQGGGNAGKQEKSEPARNKKKRNNKPE